MTTSSLTSTGNQPYTSARTDYLASYMQTQLPGMDHAAAVKWINAEQGVHGNVLGVTYRDATGQHLYQYSSQEAGIRAAVALIKSSGNYSGIRASLGQSLTAQLQAIAASPWNAPSHYRNGGTFGVSLPKGIGGSTAIPSVGSGTLASTPTAATTTLDKLLGLPSGTKIDATTAVMLRARVAELLAAGKIDSTMAQNLLQVIGSRGVASSHGSASTLGDVIVELGTGKVPIPNPVAGLLDAAAVAGDIGAFLFDVDNWKYLGAVVVGVPLALFGFYLLAGVQTGGANA